MSKIKTVKGSYVEDITGQTFNRLTVLELTDKKIMTIVGFGNVNALVKNIVLYMLLCTILNLKKLNLVDV